MLDELLNVKPAVQSLVYTLVLKKIIADKEKRLARKRQKNDEMC